MHIDWWTVGLQTINIVLLVWLLKRFFFPRIIAILDERQKKTRALLDESAALHQAAEAEKSAAEKLHADLLATRAEWIAKAQAEAEALSQSILAQAHENAARIVEQGASQRLQSAQADEERMSKRATALAGDLARRLMSRLPDDVLISTFMDGLIAEMSRQQDLLRNMTGVPVKLLAARLPTGKEEDQIRHAITQAFGQPVELVIEVDPALIAGLELCADHFRIANHLRADLEAMMRMLQHDHSA
jgi:F-type H+-transporting ATPase subunit b